MLSKRSLAIKLFCVFCVFSTKVAVAQTHGLPSNPPRNPFLPYSSGIPASAPPELKVSPNTATFSIVPGNSFGLHRLNYASAAEIKEALQNILPNSKISAEPTSNSILFNGPSAEETNLKRALQILDLPTSQITLEARVLSLSREASKSLGFNWSWDPLPQRGGESNNTLGINGNHGNFKLGRGYSFKFGATLNALIAKGQAKILASPHIVTLPGKEGKIFIGEHIPYQVDKHDSGGTYTSTEYIEAGIHLKYTPILNQNEDMITAAVHTEVSTPTLVAELKNYKVTSRKVDTTVRMQSGETLVIGGLITETEQRSLQKIPLLANIPLLGNLFKNRTRSKQKTEILLLLTPYISKAGESPAIYTEQAVKLQDEKL